MSRDWQQWQQRQREVGENGTDEDTGKMDEEREREGGEMEKGRRRRDKATKQTEDLYTRRSS